jgi:hypothetical protein
VRSAAGAASLLESDRARGAAMDARTEQHDDDHAAEVRARRGREGI